MLPIYIPACQLQGLGEKTLLEASRRWGVQTTRFQERKEGEEETISSEV